MAFHLKIPLPGVAETTTDYNATTVVPKDTYREIAANQRRRCVSTVVSRIMIILFVSAGLGGEVVEVSHEATGLYSRWEADGLPASRAQGSRCS